MNLYLIENNGCDATTYGVARMTDEEFEKFKEIVTNLNKNSTYGCMPTIDVYEIQDSDIVELEGEVPRGLYAENILYLDNKRYTYACGSRWKLEPRQVI